MTTLYRTGHGRALVSASLTFAVIVALPMSAGAKQPDAFWSRYYKPKTPGKTVRTPRPAANAGQAAGATLIPLSATCDAAAEPYQAALKTYLAKASRYWAEVGRKKKIRRALRRKKQAVRRAHYVLVHPPGYKGPGRPKCLDKAGGGKKPRPKSTLPLVSDFLSAAKKLYGFTPRRTNEWDYKRTFAREALAVGLTPRQVVGVYALETGGIGPYFRQSGIFPVNNNCKPISPRGRAASTALSYAQLLAANTSIMAREYGPDFATRLEAAARNATPARAQDLRKKAKILRRMARDIAAGLRRYKGRSNWSKYLAFAKTQHGYAVHALLLDPDLGPLLQVHKLKRIVDGARARGFKKVSAAQLELMNLAGPGTGLEMMTPVGSKVPTANFFTRGGHDRNPVVRNRLAKGLLDKLAERIQAQMGKCGSKEFLAAFRDVSG